MNLSLFAIWTIAKRDLSARIRGLRLLAICLFLGVGTLAAIGSLTAGIADDLSQRGQAILGADLEVEIAQREATEAEKAEFRKLGELSETVRLRAMAIGGDDNVLASGQEGGPGCEVGVSLIDSLFEVDAAHNDFSLI